MIAATSREMLNARIVERRPYYISRASMIDSEGNLQRTQLHRRADSLHGEFFRNIASVTTALFLAICGDRQVAETNSFVWKRALRVLDRCLHPKRTHHLAAPSNEAFVEHLPKIVRCRKGRLPAGCGKPRAIATVTIVVLSLSCVHGAALPPTGTQMALASLQAKADQAQPRDRCFLYAMLVNQMTNLAGQQFNSDDPGEASETLKLVQRYIENIRT